MAKKIMIQGTMSNAGKSLIVAGLCRIFKQDGYRVAPFKSQNMALNSYITGEGLEMGRAQVMQAEAAGIRPQVCMNPILLKPTNDTGSQVIVNGEVLENMKARDYFAYKKKLIPDILMAYHTLEQQADIIVIVGDEQHSVWCNNLFTLLKKVTADDTLYNELFMAKDKENVIQAFANTAVRVQILVRTRWGTEQ